MNVRHHLSQYFLEALMSTKRGRAHLLNQVAEGEEQGEQRVFDEAIALVEDPELKKLIRRHREDEIRHGQMFRARIEANGVPVGPVPENLDMLRRLDRALGGFFDKGLSSEADVMRAYVILQVIEERACEQFTMYIDALERVGEHETADVFRQVAKDEARHLKYCRAIALRYAEDEADYERELVLVRELEARSFKDVQRSNIEYILANDLAPSRGARLFFRVMKVVTGLVDEVPYTSFAQPAMA